MLQKNNNDLTEEIYKEILSIIKETRINKGLSQTVLGNALLVSYQQYTKYEKNIDNLKVKTLIKICQILNLDIAFVFKIAKSKVDLIQDGKGAN